MSEKYIASPFGIEPYPEFYNYTRLGEMTFRVTQEELESAQEALTRNLSMLVRPFSAPYGSRFAQQELETKKDTLIKRTLTL